MLETFRYSGDILHISSMLLLIRQMTLKRSCVGVSYHTQEIFMTVFICRYSDLWFMGIRSYYLFAMKMVFISLTILTMYFIRYRSPHKANFDIFQDSFPHYWLFCYWLLSSNCYSTSRSSISQSTHTSGVSLLSWRHLPWFPSCTWSDAEVKSRHSASPSFFVWVPIARSMQSAGALDYGLVRIISVATRRIWRFSLVWFRLPWWVISSSSTSRGPRE